MRRNTQVALVALGLVGALLVPLRNVLLDAGDGSAAPPPKVTWDPLSRPEREADTVFLPNLTSAQTIQAEGGFLAGVTDPASAAASTGFEFGPGRFGPAVRARPGSGRYVYYPVDGLLDANEFTIEFWAKSEAPWSAADTGKAIFSVATFGGNQLHVTPYRGECAVSVSALDASPGRFSGGLARPCDELGLTGAAWHHVAVTLEGGVITLFVDGTVAASVSDVRLLPLWSDGARGDGIHLSGEPGVATGFWISDTRVSRTARVPHTAVPLRPVRSSWVIDAARPIDELSPGFVGSLLTRGPATPAQLSAAVSVVREGKLLTATPMVRGTPDPSHPSAGRSGRFSYDWQVADRTMEWFKERGVDAYLDADSTPSLLGGSVPPFSGDRLRTANSSYSDYGPEPPTNLEDWAAVVGDLVHHVVNDKGYRVRLWTVWNEPDLGFWNAGMERYLDLFSATVSAIRSVDPTTRVGGPELSNFEPAWIDALFERVARDRLPLDFVSYHDYTGDLGTLDRARAVVDDAAARHGRPTPFPIVIGEFNWTLANVYRSASSSFGDDPWHLQALGAAYTTAYLTRVAQTPGYRELVYAHTSYDDPRVGGAAALQLIGPRGEQWAPYNALKGWKEVVQPWRLQGSGDHSPGVFPFATGDPDSGKVGLVLANWGWAQREERVVDVTIRNLPAGKWRLQRSLVDRAHSSRWDIAQDAPEGARQNDLSVVESRTLKVGADGTARLTLNLPALSSTFVSLQPTAARK